MEHHVSTVQDLTAAFSAAQPGDSITLAPGDYGRIFLQGRSFDSPGLVIRSQDPDTPAVFTEFVRLEEVSGVRLEGVDLLAGQVADGPRNGRLVIQSSQDIALVDMEIAGHVPTLADGAIDPAKSDAKRFDMMAGYPYEVGILARDISGLTLENVTLHDVRVAASFGQVSDAMVSEVHIHSVREGLNIFDVRDLTVTQTKFHSFVPWFLGAHEEIDHPDMIQYWGDNSEFGIENITISHNLFYQPPGFEWSHGMLGHMRGDPDHVRARDITITDNFILNGHTNGIYLGDVVGAKITRNILLPSDPAIPRPLPVDAPGIHIKRGQDVEIWKNMLLPYGRRGDGGIRLDPEARENGDVKEWNNMRLSTDPTQPHFWGHVLNQLDLSHNSHNGTDAHGLCPPPAMLICPHGDTPMVFALNQNLGSELGPTVHMVPWDGTGTGIGTGTTTAWVGHPIMDTGFAPNLAPIDVA